MPFKENFRKGASKHLRGKPHKGWVDSNELSTYHRLRIQVLNCNEERRVMNNDMFRKPKAKSLVHERPQVEVPEPKRRKAPPRNKGKAPANRSEASSNPDNQHEGANQTRGSDEAVPQHNGTVPNVDLGAESMMNAEDRQNGPPAPLNHRELQLQPPDAFCL